MGTRDLLDLLRIPNVFTAVSDVAAATAVVSAASPQAVRWEAVAWTAGASAALYCAGMSLNDVADAPTDAAERPGRPIPSGRVRRGEAVGITVMLALAGLGMAWAAGASVLLVAAVLLAMIVAYDLGLAGRPLYGPATMALCRSLNLLLGLVAAGDLTGVGLIALAVWFVYVFGLTHLSLGEVSGSPRLAVVIASLTTVLSILTLVGLARHHGADRSALTWIAFAAGILLCLFSGGPALVRAFENPGPQRVGPAVGGLVGGLVGLGATLATAVGSAAWLLVFLALAAAHRALRRSFRVT
jgi:4-hydroxybenzoate polyprenyltransferase